MKQQDKIKGSGIMVITLERTGCSLKDEETRAGRRDWEEAAAAKLRKGQPCIALLRFCGVFYNTLSVSKITKGENEARTS